MKTLGLLIFCMFLLSCGPISVSRSFVDEMDESKDDRYFVAGESFDVTPGDSGRDIYKRNEMLSRTPAKERDFPDFTESSRLQKELNRKVAKLTPEQKIWFDRNSEYFQNESEKLYFLGLNETERESFLAQRGKIGKMSQRSPASLVRYSPRQAREVALGMDKNNVRRLWGNPHRVDVAGDPKHENERWTFYERGTKKYIYFSKGSVEGWVTE